MPKNNGVNPFNWFTVVKNVEKSAHTVARSSNLFCIVRCDDHCFYIGYCFTTQSGRDWQTTHPIYQLTPFFSRQLTPYPNSPPWATHLIFLNIYQALILLKYSIFNFICNCSWPKKTFILASFVSSQSIQVIYNPLLLARNLFWCLIPIPGRPTMLYFFSKYASI